jgi:hypothetical protein
MRTHVDVPCFLRATPRTPCRAGEALCQSFEGWLVSSFHFCERPLAVVTRHKPAFARNENAEAGVAFTRMPHSAKEKGRSKDPFTAALLLCCTSGVLNAQNEEERNTTASALPTPLGFSCLSHPAPQTPTSNLHHTTTYVVVFEISGPRYRQGADLAQGR